VFVKYVDILSEETLMDWIRDRKSHESKYSTLFKDNQVQEFVNWLEDQNDDDDDDDDDEEDDDSESEDYGGSSNLDDDSSEDGNDCKFVG
jgi:hypothetical protein